MEVIETLDKSCFGEIVRMKKRDWNGKRRIGDGMYGQLFAEVFTKGSREMG